MTNTEILLKQLEEYLQRPSLDGRSDRQAMRSELKQLLILIKEEKDCKFFGDMPTCM